MTLSITHGFSALAADYDVVLSDVWGVVHNGATAWDNACDALARFRAQGGTVILISNAPRPGERLLPQLDALHVPREAYDRVVTSGDITVGEMAKRAGVPVFHIGPERDHGLFEGSDAPRVAAVEDAHYVVCSGLFDDETETPDDYRPMLEKMLAQKIPMICANPDLIVERGNKLVYCAGAIADLYQKLGGEVLYAGKPHAPVYELAFATAEKLRGRAVPRERIVAIGDSVRTDLAGASHIGIDCIFVTSGIHAEELGAREAPDLAKLAVMFTDAGLSARAVTRQLAW
jgi:HAD superfamily hydrolase (TIGR01459 family)